VSDFGAFNSVGNKDNLPMKKTNEGVEDGYLGRSQEVDRSGGGHSVDVGGSGHGARSQRMRIRPMGKESG
nr:hypothetical protein [Tanacetum cinerariifolium]